MSNSVPTSSGFRAPPLWVVMLFIILGVTALGAAFFIPLSHPTQARQSEVEVAPPEYLDTPPFVLTERNGDTVDNASLDGKVWVAAFAFTRCKYCPQVSSAMARLRKEMALTDNDDFRLVTFTIDPEHDTPDELKKYAENFTKSDDRRWLFLHGPERFMRLFCVRGFKVAVEKKEGVEVGLMYDHYLGLMVVDKRGQVRGRFLGKPPEREGANQAYEENFKEMKDKIAELLKE